MKKDLTPWLLLPSVVLALGSVTLLAPHQAALAGPPTPPQAVPQAPAGDGDGDELLEHWGDPQFSHEAQKQMAGMAAGFLVLGTAAAVRRKRRFKPVLVETVLVASELDSQKRVTPSASRSDTRKAA